MRAQCKDSPHIPISGNNWGGGGGTQCLDKVVLLQGGVGVCEKGIMEWFSKWCWHCWRMLSGEVGHNDLWEAILMESEAARRKGWGVCAVAMGCNWRG